MADFVLEETPMIGGLPLEMGALKLRLVEHDAITAVMSAKGERPALFVEIGEVKDTEHGPLVWAGQDQAFLFGSVEACEGAYLADISDGWVFFALEGEGAEHVMARLAPIELRKSKVFAGKSFRTQLGHLQALIVTSEKGYEIGVMSSFAKTAMHEIKEAMETVAALYSLK